MEQISLGNAHLWKPLARFGLTSPFWGVDTTIIFQSWVAIVLLLLLAGASRWALMRQKGISGYLARFTSTSLAETVVQARGVFDADLLSFVGSLFFIILAFNLLPLLPLLEEPTRDLNTAFALAFITFGYGQLNAIRARGFASYLGHHFKTPLNFTPRFNTPLVREIEYVLRFLVNIAAGIIALPMELLGKVSIILSLSFRLFGNIFGGFIIMHLVGALLAAWWPLQFLLAPLRLAATAFFGLMEGIIQAFIFAMISINYVAMNRASAPEGTSSDDSNRESDLL